MRKLIVILPVLLFALACSKHTPDNQSCTQKPNESIVIDYPVGVLLKQKNQPSQALETKSLQAQKLLSPLHIPLLDTVGQNLVFVKNNGDRIEINASQLSENYDIILFNRDSNPIPVRITELQNAVNLIFNSKTGLHLKKSDISESNQLPEIADTTTITLFNQFIRLLKHRENKTIIIDPAHPYPADLIRQIPGIKYIEHQIDRRKFFKLQFENDLITYANTDRYFTNGILFGWQSPRLARNPLTKTMLPYHHKALVSYQLDIMQDMFTSFDTRVAPSPGKDRPFASYLYINYQKKYFDSFRKTIFTSQISIGYLGPKSPGAYLQTIVHKTFPTNDVPLGWETQIKTDLILNYNIGLSKSLINKDKFSLDAGVTGCLGTLYDNVATNAHIKAGKHFNPFGKTGFDTHPETEFYFFAGGETRLVAYNALLQGGILNNNNVSALGASDVKKIVASAYVGLHFRYRKIGIEVAQHYLTPEFKGGVKHKWGRISLILGH